MSARRKQSRPKSFGVNSDEPGAEGDAPQNTDTLNSGIEVNEANKENGESVKMVLAETNEMTNMIQIESYHKSANQNELELEQEEGEEEEDEEGDDEPILEGESESQEQEYIKLSNGLKRKRSSEEDEEEDDEEEDDIELDETGADLANLIDDLDDEDEERDEFKMDNEALWRSMRSGSSDSKLLTPRKHLDDISDQNITSLIVNRSRDDSLSMDLNILAFKCKVCHKGFKHRRSLNRHVKLHSGEKNFKCLQCSSAFARSDHLKAHLRTHNNSKPYKCSVCQCGYNTQAALKVHIAHHHSKSKFRCTLCDNLEFHSQLALEGHIYTKHSKDNIELSLDEDLNFEMMSVNKAKYHEIKFDEGSEGENGVSGESLEDMLMSEENGGDAPTNQDPSLNHQEPQAEEQEESSKNEKSNPVTKLANGDYRENENQEILNNTPNLDEEEDDVIYDSHLNSSNPQFKRNGPKVQSFNGIRTPLSLQHPPPPPPPLLSPAQHVRPGATVNPMPQITKTGSNMPQRVAYSTAAGANTYCEMCNARFSSVESYVAHMRNCHPSVPFQAHNSPASAVAASKMPYLTSILAKGSPKPPINGAANGGIIIPLVHPPPHNLHHGALKAQTCNIPNCNCPLSTAHRDLETDDYFVLKETHYSCAQCNMTFFKVNDYMSHLKQEHCVEVFRCVLCKQMQLFDNLLLLKEHFFLVSAFIYSRCTPSLQMKSLKLSNFSDFGQRFISKS